MTQFIEKELKIKNAEEAPKASLEGMLDELKNNEKIKEVLKDKVCFVTKIHGGEGTASITMKFVHKDYLLFSEIAGSEVFKKMAFNMVEFMQRISKEVQKAMEEKNND